MKLLLIDGDQYLFKATAAIEREIRWDDQNHVLYANEDEAWANFARMIKALFDRFETKQHAMCFSSPPNFRLKVDATYKGNRSPRKPLCYATLRELCETEYNTISMPGLEADDVMGILATKPGKHQRIIVSQDKDMKTIPATIWNGEKLVTVSEAEADRWHLYQTITGDASDGYPGCPGAGPVAADEFLKEPYILTAYEHVLKSGPRKGTSETRWSNVPLAEGQRPWDGIVSIYQAAGLTEADALQQARLARILRWSDWDADKKEPILWMPPTS